MSRTSAFCLIALIGVLFVASVQAQSSDQSLTEKNPPPKSVVKGRVIYEDTGLPVRRGRITLIEISEYLEGNGSILITDLTTGEYVLTDDDGNFEMRYLKAGKYIPSVNVPNVLSPRNVNDFYGRTVVVSITQMERFFQRIDLDGLNEKQVEIRVKRGAVIGGRVLYSDGSPAIAVKVGILKKGMSVVENELVELASALTDDRGTFRITKLLPGDYFIRIVEPADHGINGRPDSWRRFYRASKLFIFYPGVERVNAAEAVSVNWGEERSDVNLFIPDRKLFSASGVIFDKSGSVGVKGAQLNVYRVLPEAVDELVGSSELVTDSSGNWSLKDLPAGKYRIRVSHPGSIYETYEDTRKPTGEIARFGTIDFEFEIDDEDLNGVVIELPRAASVSGTVTVINGLDVPYLDLVLADYERKLTRRQSNYSWLRKKERDKTSRKTWDFNLRGLSAGDYVLRVRSLGRYITRVSVNGKELSNSELRLAEAQELESVEITLSGTPGRFFGRFTLEDGSPAAAKYIQLIPVGDAAQQNADRFFGGVTSVDGKLGLEVAPGEYFVVVRTKRGTDADDNWIRRIVKNAPRTVVRADNTTNSVFEISETDGRIHY